MMKKALIIIILVLLALAGLGFRLRTNIQNWFFQPTDSSIEVGLEKPGDDIIILTEGLDTPWSMTFLPNGDMLITERSGTLKRLGENGQTFPISGVRETSEGGLLGIALHPEFTNNNQLYLYLTTDVNGRLENRVDSYTIEGDELTFRRTILAGIPAASNHNGGDIKFGPDGRLYITTGDAARPELAQNTGSLAGKILRLNDDGSIPSDNPFSNLIWSYGHRNPQGIAWDEQGRLWSVEHGPSGMQTGEDELNLIEKGGNYGWPTITGDREADGMRTPVAHSGKHETWAPAGLAYAEGSLYFAGLRGQSLYQAKIQGDSTTTLRRHLPNQYGRLRAVAVKDSALFFSTSNRDGRGTPHASDDKIISLSIIRLSQ